MVVSKLFKKYGNFDVLEDINIDIKSSGFYLIYGESGQGKSTLFNIISGNERPDKGYADLENQNISYCTSKNQLIEILTPNDMFRLISKDKEKIKYYIDYFSLNKVKNKMNKNLSSGERERVQIILALLSNSNILLFDEPTANLDINTSIKTYELLKEESLNRIIIVVSHDTLHIKEYADEIYGLKNHKLNLEKKSDNEVSNLNLQESSSFNKSGLLVYSFKSKFYHPFIGFFSLIFVALLMIFITIFSALFFLDSKESAKDMSQNLIYDFYAGEYSDKYHDKDNGIVCLNLSTNNCTAVTFIYDDLIPYYDLQEIHDNECLVSNDFLKELYDSTKIRYSIGDELKLGFNGYSDTFIISGICNINLHSSSIVISNDQYNKLIDKGIYEYNFNWEFEKIKSKYVSFYYNSDLQNLSAFAIKFNDIPCIDDVDSNYKGLVYIGNKPESENDILVSNYFIYRALNTKLTNDDYYNSLLTKYENYTTNNCIEAKFFESLLGENYLKNINVVGLVVYVSNKDLTLTNSIYLNNDLYDKLYSKIHDENKNEFNYFRYYFHKSTLNQNYNKIIDQELNAYDILPQYLSNKNGNMLNFIILLIITGLSFGIELAYLNLTHQNITEDLDKLNSLNFSTKDKFHLTFVDNLISCVYMIICCIFGNFIAIKYLRDLVKEVSNGSSHSNYLIVILINVLIISICILFKNIPMFRKKEAVRKWEE